MTIFKRTLQLVERAREKGFPDADLVAPIFFQTWKDPNKAFCNVACSVISMWLREKEIYVNVAGLHRGAFSYFVKGPNLTKIDQPQNIGGNVSWEEAWLEGIEEGLKLINTV